MEMTKLMGKCGAGMASAWNGMKRTAGNTKQDGRIVDAEKKIERLTVEIGHLTIHKLDAGMKATEDITERYNAILEARKEIKAAEGDKEHTKVVCPHCGKKFTAGMRFCGFCGKEIQATA